MTKETLFLQVLIDKKLSSMGLKPSPKGFDSSTQGNALGTRSRHHYQPSKGVTPMPQSLSKILVHLIFSTKHGEPLITPNMRPRPHAYMVGILNNLKSPS